MPHRISREEAVARLERERPKGCTMCALVERGARIARSEHASVILSRYPVRWGHLLVVPHLHAERFEELSVAAWIDATSLAHRAATTLERALRPARTYVASLGTNEASLPMTFAHIHLNVIPVAESGARPREVLTWQHGVVDGTPSEWEILSTLLVGTW